MEGIQHAQDDDLSGIDQHRDLNTVSDMGVLDRRQLNMPSNGACSMLL